MKPKTRVSVFEPNRADGDPMNMLGTVIGGLAKESLNRFPKSPMASILWEVFWMHQNPLSMFIQCALIVVWGRFIVPANTCCPGKSRVWGAHQDHSAEAEVLADLRPDSGGEVRSANQYEISMAFGLRYSCRAWQYDDASN
jgi:hypothetical protein